MAALRNQRVEIRYYGGSQPGKLRTISPAALFMVKDMPQAYMLAYCHTRQANRTFLVEKVDLVTGG